MTTQDLIIGHFEGTLTETQQLELDGLLKNSPEVQALYEQHGMIEEAMKEEAEELVPPFGLKEATLGAALVTAVETIGGGIAAWFTSKAAVAIGTVIVGGAAVGLGVMFIDGNETVEQGKEEPVPAAVAVDNSEEEPVYNAESGNVEQTSNDAKPSSTSNSVESQPSTRQNIEEKEPMPSSVASTENSNGEIEEETFELNGLEEMPRLETDEIKTVKSDKTSQD